jgi:DNA repair protein RadC
MCATLSKRNEVLGIYQVSSGSNSGTIVDITKITAKAILTNASAVILAHNHPSGNPKPSPQDIDITKKLKSALDLFDIRLLDHIILYQEDSVKYTSMAEEGYM